MRHRYDARGIVLSRSPLGEANALLTVLLPELGLVRARAQGLRRHGAKLAPALATLTESDLILVRGKEGWRIAGAVLDENWFRRLPEVARARASRVSGLLVRFAPGEASDNALFFIFKEFLEALAKLPENLHDAAEILAALRILAALGLDAGALPENGFEAPALEEVVRERASYIARINRGIAASEL